MQAADESSELRLAGRQLVRAGGASTTHTPLAIHLPILLPSTSPAYLMPFLCRRGDAASAGGAGAAVWPGERLPAERPTVPGLIGAAGACPSAVKNFARLCGPRKHDCNANACGKACGREGTVCAAERAAAARCGGGNELVQPGRRPPPPTFPHRLLHRGLEPASSNNPSAFKCPCTKPLGARLPTGRSAAWMNAMRLSSAVAGCTWRAALVAAPLRAAPRREARRRRAALCFSNGDGAWACLGWAPALAAPRRRRLSGRRRAAPLRPRSCTLAGRVSVTFKLPYHCKYGQKLCLIGSNEVLGGWRVESAVPMNWTEVGGPAGCCDMHALLLCCLCTLNGVVP